MHVAQYPHASSASQVQIRQRCDGSYNQQYVSPITESLCHFGFYLLLVTHVKRLVNFLVQRTLQRDPDAPQTILDKERERFCHAPVVITVVARLQPTHQVPKQEQLLTTGCVCFALLQAAQAYGFGAQWLTGWMAYDRTVAKYLHLGPHEHIIGFIHIGTPRLEVPERERPDVDALLHNWTP